MKTAIISFLSDYRKYENPPFTYLCPGEEPVEGTYTNEAPLKYLLRKISREKTVDKENGIKLLLICSEKVHNELCFSANYIPLDKTLSPNEALSTDDKPDEKTIYDYYAEKLISDCCDSLGLGDGCIEAVEIPYGVSGGDEVSGEIAAEVVYREISKSLADCDSVYIEYTGGPRDITYLLTALIRFSETKGKKFEGIVYGYLDQKKNEGRIEDISYIYKANKVSEAVNDFKETGSPEKLIDIFYKKSDDEENKNPVNTLLMTLRGFIHAVVTGDIDGLDKIRDRIISKLEIIENEKPGSDIPDPLNYDLFRRFLPDIKASLHIEKNKLDYPEIVEWCLDHRFLQAAVTIYIEKIPKIYCEKGINNLGLDEENNQRSNRGTSSESELFYTKFFDKIYPAPNKYKEFGAKLSEKVKDLKKDNNLDKITFSVFKRFKNTASFYETFNDEEQSAYGKIINYLDSYVNDGEFKYGSIQEQIGKNKRLNTLLTDKRFYCFMDCNNPGDCLIIEPDFCPYAANSGGSQNNDNSFDPVGNIEKKLDAIKNLKTYNDNNDSPFDLERIVRIMYYYLLIKNIRNRINHAAGLNYNGTDANDNGDNANNTNKDPLETVGEKFLEQYASEWNNLTDVKKLFGYSNIKTIIQKGINLTKEIRDSEGDLIDKDEFEKIINS